MRHRANSARRVVLLLAALTTTAACTGPAVRTDYDPETDFATLTSWAWLEPPREPDANPFQDNDLLRMRVRTAVERELAERGLQRAPADEASLLVTFHVTIETKTTSYTSPGAFGGYAGGGYGYGAWGGYNETTSYQQGTLILDVVDRARDRLVWRGWTSGVVPTADSDRERVDRAVREILARFPPKREGADDT